MRHPICCYHHTYVAPTTGIATTTQTVYLLLHLLLHLLLVLHGLHPPQVQVSSTSLQQHSWRVFQSILALHGVEHLLAARLLPHVEDEPGDVAEVLLLGLGPQEHLGSL